MSHLRLAELIGSIVSDIVSGDQLAAKTSIALIKEIGFKDDSPSDQTNWGQLRMIEFSYSLGNDNKENELRKYQIPLLSLLPLSIFSISETDVEFNVNLENFVKRKFEQMHSKTVQNEFKVYDVFTRMEKLDSKDVGVIKFNIKIKSSDLPGGITNLLRVLDNNSKEK